MDENIDESNYEGISTEKSSSETVNATGKEMLKQLIEKQIEQDKINKEIIENQQKLMEKLQSIEDKQDGKKQKQEESDSENPAKSADLNTSAIDQNGQEEHEVDTSETTTSPGLLNQKSGKCFTLKHTFKNVSRLENQVKAYSEEQEHFGLIWKMFIVRIDEQLAVFAYCHNNAVIEKWSVEADCEMKLLSKNGKPIIQKSRDAVVTINTEKLYGWCCSEFEKWDVLGQWLSIDDSLTFEVSVNIKKTTGVYKDDLRCFNDPECSDVVLVVQDKKFYVSKLYLATHSSYFKAMFLGLFGESKKSEIPLTGIDADDFQKYLEVLYGDDAIEEYTVEGILMVSDMFDTQIVIKKCQQFLLEKSKKTLKKKLEMSVRYNLEELKKGCLSKVDTVDEIRELIPGDVRDLDPSLMADLLEKALAFDYSYIDF